MPEYRFDARVTSDATIVVANAPNEEEARNQVRDNIADGEPDVTVEVEWGYTHTVDQSTVSLQQ